jgi:hypothetical protein
LEPNWSLIGESPRERESSTERESSIERGLNRERDSPREREGSRERDLKSQDKERESSPFLEVHVLNLVYLTNSTGSLHPWPHGHGASYDPYA